MIEHGRPVFCYFFDDAWLRCGVGVGGDEIWGQGEDSCPRQRGRSGPIMLMLSSTPMSVVGLETLI
jgi:hypothetical protein